MYQHSHSPQFFVHFFQGAKLLSFGGFWSTSSRGFQDRRPFGFLQGARKTCGKTKKLKHEMKIYKEINMYYICLYRLYLHTQSMCIWCVLVFFRANNSFLWRSLTTAVCPTSALYRGWFRMWWNFFRMGRPKVGPGMAGWQNGWFPNGWVLGTFEASSIPQKGGYYSRIQFPILDL